jgi:hypothetical protein
MRIMAKEVKTDVTKITVNDVLGRLSGMSLSFLWTRAIRRLGLNPM